MYIFSLPTLPNFVVYEARLKRIEDRHAIEKADLQSKYGSQLQSSEEKSRHMSRQAQMEREAREASTRNLTNILKAKFSDAITEMNPKIISKKTKKS